MQRAVHGVHGSLHAIVLTGPGDDRATVVGPDGPVFAGPVQDIGRSWRPPADVRWVWWSAQPMARLRQRAPIDRCWDVAEAHRLLVGGSAATPDLVWARTHDLDPDRIPAPPDQDLFGLLEPTGDGGLTTEAGYLDPVTADPLWRDQHAQQWATALLHTAVAQAALLATRPHGVSTATSESGAAWLCVELEQDGLPLDRARMEQLITEAAGPRPVDERQARAIRAQRDELVLRHVPGVRADLRNPAQVRELLRSVGVLLEDTRAWHLEPYRHVHPVVDALLTWRKNERVATTYGWSWLDRFVGPDDRLRGPWTACDGGAGRMTAGAGLHSLPIPLRPGVAAAPGHRFVRADLGQVEPRVLAVVSGDPAFAQATLADDLYAQVARELQLGRPEAKIAVLAAMYGQTTGPAADALARMDAAFPVAMRYLRDAAARGEAGQDVMTYGGRLIRVPGAQDAGRRRAFGRFARNAVVQGAAAELFKAWTLTVRAAAAPLGGQLVLCLHDELLVHVPAQHADQLAARVDQALTDAARRWSAGAPVRFVADTSVIERWSQAKQ